MHDLKERLMQEVVKSDDGCWLWTGHLNLGGYGQFTLKGKPWRAHVASYVVHVGPVPKGLCVLHTCDVRNCVNPSHLFADTYQANVDDMRAKGRDVYGENRGMRNGSAKLTEEDVHDIRRQINMGRTNVEIAESFNVRARAISNIRTRRNWAWLQEGSY